MKKDPKRILQLGLEKIHSFEFDLSFEEKR